MPEPKHFLDRRAELTASKMREHMHGLVDALGPGIPFHERVGLSWWVDNIDTPMGQEELKRFNPLQIMNLKRLVAAKQEAGPVAPPDYDAPAVEG